MFVFVFVSACMCVGGCGRCAFTQPFSLWQEEIDKKEKMTAGLNQTVRELQQLLQTVSRQLAKGQEGVRPAQLLSWSVKVTWWHHSPEAPRLIFLHVWFPPGGWQRSAQGIVRGGQTPPTTTTTPQQPPRLHDRDLLWPFGLVTTTPRHTVTPSHLLSTQSPHLYRRQPFTWLAEALLKHLPVPTGVWKRAGQTVLLIPNTPDTVPKHTTPAPTTFLYFNSIARSFFFSSLNNDIQHNLNCGNHSSV